MSRLKLFRVIAIGVAIAAVWLLHAAFEVVVVPTPSMERTVMVGDHLLINQWAYRWKNIHRGDVISFYPPDESRGVYLKRVVGVGGDLVESRAGVIFVNGVPLAEPYAYHECEMCREQWSAIFVPEGQLFVLGDNREFSEDSRYWGTVSEKNVIGAPVLVLWSFAASTREWMSTPVAVYLNHPWEHLRWARFFRVLR